MKKCLVLISLVLANAIVHAADDVVSISGLLRNACLAGKEFKQDDKKFQSYMTIAAASFAMVPVAYALGKAVNELRKTKIGVINIKGAVNDAMISQCCAQIEAFKKDKSIKAVILKICSGGGLSYGGDYIRNELKMLAEIKPVIAMIEGFCASAAYHIAAASHYIIAPEKSAVGSIGTYRECFKYTGDAEHNKLGLGFYGMSAPARVETFKAGKYKALHDPFKEFTDEERAYLQKGSDEQYEMFYTNVAEDRNLSVDTKDEWAEAQVFTGKRALEVGLIDEIGTITNAKETIKRLVAEHTGKRVGELRFVYHGFSRNAGSWMSLFSADSVAQFAHDFCAKFQSKQQLAHSTNFSHIIE